MTPLSALLTDARHRSGLSQQQLAKQAAAISGRGYDPDGIRAVIAAYESGRREPSLPMTAAILDALDLDLAVIPRVSGGRRKAT